MKTPSKVFVVDDEPMIATTLATILRMSGFEADSFTSPEDALRAAELGQPNLLISDVMMPGMTGVTLAIRIRSVCPACKILLFSGQAATSDLLKEARRDGHHFMLLQKPVHPSEFLSTIQGMGS